WRMALAPRTFDGGRYREPGTGRGPGARRNRHRPNLWRGVYGGRDRHQDRHPLAGNAAIDISHYAGADRSTGRQYVEPSVALYPWRCRRNAWRHGDEVG